MSSVNRGSIPRMGADRFINSRKRKEKGLWRKTEDCRTTPFAEKQTERMLYDVILNKDYGVLSLPTTDMEASTRVCEWCMTEKSIRKYRRFGGGYRHICMDCEDLLRRQKGNEE